MRTSEGCNFSRGNEIIVSSVDTPESMLIIRMWEQSNKTVEWWRVLTI